jgi:hypothetical protein
MDGILSRVGLMTSPRSLLALSLMLSVLSASGGRGTLAYFTSSAASGSLTFSSGQIDITPSTLPASASMSWNTSGGGTDCKTLTLETNATDTTAQAMVPGQFCVAKVTISNTATNAVDAWMRIRLVRDTTAVDTTTQALNNRLKFYMSEYATGGATAQTNDCTTSTFIPTASTALTGTAATGKSNSVIADGAVTGGTRAALTALGAGGKNIGTHPTIFAPADTTATTYFGTTTETQPAAAQSGLAIVAGAGSATNETTFSTLADTTRNAFNLVGNDEVTNPRKTGNGTTLNGNRVFSSNTEAELLAAATRYYCAAIFFPSDVGVVAANGDITPAGTVTSITDLNTKGDNAAKNTSLSYRLIVTAAQKAGRSANT